MKWIWIVLFLSGCATQRYWSGYSKGHKLYEAFNKNGLMSSWEVGFIKGWAQGGTHIVRCRRIFCLRAKGHTGRHSRHEHEAGFDYDNICVALFD